MRRSVRIVVMRETLNVAGGFLERIADMRYHGKSDQKQTRKLQAAMEIMYYFCTVLSLEQLRISWWRRCQKLFRLIADLPKKYAGKRKVCHITESVVYCWFSPGHDGHYIGQIVKGFDVRTFQHVRYMVQPQTYRRCQLPMYHYMRRHGVFKFFPIPLTGVVDTNFSEMKFIESQWITITCPRLNNPSVQRLIKDSTKKTVPITPGREPPRIAMRARTDDRPHPSRCWNRSGIVAAERFNVYIGKFASVLHIHMHTPIIIANKMMMKKRKGDRAVKDPNFFDQSTGMMWLIRLYRYW